MNFNSLEYIVFLGVVLVGYISLRHTLQNRLLLLASYAFYSAWDWRFLGLILISTTVDYLVARALGRAEHPLNRKYLLWISFAVNLSFLGFFKYFNFFLENFLALFASLGVELHGPTWQILLPVGISFYTFQTLSYVIDVYRKDVEPARNYLDYALYVSFFPQLVAGPIERGRNLMPQILQPRTVTRENVNEGLFLIYWGLFKKVFIADNLGAYLLLMDKTDPDGGLILVGMYLYMFQLYCDFSAYSDIARGTAKLLGFELMLNFRAPYFAPNIQELWQRWHISLTSWIRDYLYYPLVLSRFNKKSLNPKLIIIVTFTIMGFWHGASWNFVLWGLYNGIMLALYAWIQPKLRKTWKQIPPWLLPVATGLSIFITFHVMLIGDVFFRFTDTQLILFSLYHLFFNLAITAEAWDLFRILIGYIAPLLLLDILIYRHDDDLQRLFRYPAWARYGFFLFTLLLFATHPGQADSFIYFQF